MAHSFLQQTNIHITQNAAGQVPPNTCATISAFSVSNANPYTNTSSITFFLTGADAEDNWGGWRITVTRDVDGATVGSSSGGFAAGNTSATYDWSVGGSVGDQFTATAEVFDDDVTCVPESEVIAIRISNDWPDISNIVISPSGGNVSFKGSIGVSFTVDDSDNHWGGLAWNWRISASVNGVSNAFYSSQDTLGGTGSFPVSRTISIPSDPLHEAYVGQSLTILIEARDAYASTSSSTYSFTIYNFQPSIISFQATPPAGSTIVFGTDITFNFSAIDTDGNWDGASDWELHTSVSGVPRASLDRSGSFPGPYPNKGTVSGTTTIRLDQNVMNTPEDVVVSCLTVIDSKGSSATSCLTFNGVCPVQKIAPRRPITTAVEQDPDGDTVLGSGEAWGACDVTVGQKYRDVMLRYSDCHLVEYREMQGCQSSPMFSTPVISTTPLEAACGGPSPAPNQAFGTLGSTVIIKGDYFYPIQAVADFYKRRTHTEVRFGGVKIAGTDNYSNPDVPFVANPTCVNPNATACTLRAYVSTSVPECSTSANVQAVVKPYFFNIVGTTWDSGENEPTVVANGYDTYVVIPSVEDGGGGFRPAEFTITRANKAVNNSFNNFLAATPENQGPVGLPLTLTIENAYFAQSTIGRSCIFGGVLCGFGEPLVTEVRFGNEPGVITFAPSTGFFNTLFSFIHNMARSIAAFFVDPFSAVALRGSQLENQSSLYPQYAAASSRILGERADIRIAASLCRDDKLVDFYEVGKPWSSKQIFPLVPFLNENALPGTVEAYVCGGNIGYIKSTNDFQLTKEPFELHHAVPAWGSVAAGQPQVNGYNLSDPLAGTLGGNTISLVGGDVIRDITLPDDATMPLGTTLAPLTACRAGYCSTIHQPITKSDHTPGSVHLPEIISVSSPKNWASAPVGVSETVPYREQYCTGETVTIDGYSFGSSRGAQVVQLWSRFDGAWKPVANYTSWADSKIVFTVPNVRSEGLVSVDCPRGNTNMQSSGDLSDLSLPVRICTGAACRDLDQQQLRAVPPGQARIIESRTVLSSTYCLEDTITLIGSGFGNERLGATVMMQGQEVSRYLKWSDTKLIVTPPAIFSGQQSPECPRRNPHDGPLTAITVGALTDVSIICPSNAQGARTCLISFVDSFSTANPVYIYNSADVGVYRACQAAQILFVPSFAVGTSGTVDIFSPEAGWGETSIITWGPANITVSVPARSYERKSNLCASLKEVSVWTGPLRVCTSGACHYVGFNNRIPLQQKAPIHKQYLTSPTPETVVIHGRYFDDIKNTSLFNSIVPVPADQRNTGYVEFYSEEFGFVPAGGYISWTDTEIRVEPPKVTLDGGRPDEGMSVAGQPMRVCTWRGCSTNLVPPLSRNPGEEEYWPEGLTFEPACMPADASAVGKTVLLTVYGKDLDRVSSGYIVLDDGPATRVDLTIYNGSGFRQQFVDRIVFEVPADTIIIPADPEPQVITGKIFLTSAFGPDREVPPRVTFSLSCNEVSRCIDAPVISAVSAASGVYTFTGCNYGEAGTASVFIFGDIVVPHEFMTAVSWSDASIQVVPPLGISSRAVFALNAWTGLMSYPAVLHTSVVGSSPVVSFTGPAVGVAGQIVDIYGGGFCVDSNCTLTPESVLFGLWQSDGAPSLELKGVPARVFDFNDELMRVEVPDEPAWIGNQANASFYKDRLGVSGQIRFWRGDGEASIPFYTVDKLSPRATPTPVP